MTLVYAEQSRALPLVSISLSFRAGRVHDPEGRGGVAHATAGMLRRGAGELSAPEVEEQLERLGAELGQHVGLGTTTFAVEMLARSRGAVAELVSTLLGSPRFDVEELGRLRRQMQADLVQARDSDAYLAARALRRAVLGAHPHAERGMGTDASIERIEQGDVARFHGAHYVRKNAIVGMSGDLRDHEVDALATALLERLPEGAPTPYDVPEPEPPAGRRLVFVDKPGRTQCQLAVGTLGTHPHDPDHDALQVANAAFGGTFTSRLTQEIRVDRGWSYNASSHLSSGQRRELFTMWTGPSTEDAADCLAHQLAMLEAWHESGVTEEELAFCVEFLCRSYAFEIDTPRKRVQQKVEAALLGLPEDYFAGYLDRTRAVTLEQANAAVRRRIDPARVCVAAVGSDDESFDALRAALPGAAADRLPHDRVD